MQYVIVGNGVASIGAIEGIREHDSEGSIIVLSDEDIPSYGRPLISYYLAEKISYKGLPLRPDSFYEEHKATLRLNTRVAQIDAKNSAIITTDGESIPYDRLLLATGGSPFIPELPGVDGPGVYTFTQKSDAEALMEALKDMKKVAVVGAGLIALKAAEALAERGLEVTLIVRSRLMRAYLDEVSGRIVADHLEEMGLHFMGGANPVEIIRDMDGTVRMLKTDQGFLETDAVIMAAGVKPNMKLAESAGITVNQGIVADEALHTSVDGVFAAGDVAEARDMFTGEPVVMPIWPNAYHQGYYAGMNMAGADKPYSGTLNMNSITFYGLPTMSIGKANPREPEKYDIHSFIDEKNHIYRKLVFEGNALVGCILIGDVDHAGFYSSFIRFRFPVDEEARQKLINGTPCPLDWPPDFFEQRLESILT